MEFEPMLTPREKPLYRKISPEEDRTRDAVDSEPKHYQLSYSGPQEKNEAPRFETRSKQTWYIVHPNIIQKMQVIGVKHQIGLRRSMLRVL